jgi:hypothetical protein
MMGLPPTGKSSRGCADFIRIAGDKIKQDGISILDARAGATLRAGFASSGRSRWENQASTGKASAGVQHHRARKPLTGETRVLEQQSAIVSEMMSMNGSSWVGVTVGSRMMTISAWESPKDPRQLLTGGSHADAMKKFFGTELAAGGFTSVWVPDRINTRWIRCVSCGRMADHERSAGTCSCGKTLADPLSYW